MKFIKFLNILDKNKKDNYKCKLITNENDEKFNEYYEISKQDLCDELNESFYKFKKYFDKTYKKVKNYEKINIGIIKNGYFYLPNDPHTKKNYFEFLYFDKGTKTFKEIYDLAKNYYTHLFEKNNFTYLLTDIIPINLKSKKFKKLSKYKNLENSIVYVCCDLSNYEFELPEYYTKIPIWCFGREEYDYNSNDLVVNIVIEFFNLCYEDYSDFILKLDE